MKKFIIILSIILFSISYVIVCLLGQEKTINYDLKDVHSVEVECDKKIIKCEKVIENNNISIVIKSIKPGKTYLKIYKDDNQKKDVYHLSVYVHPFGVVTVGSYLGKCDGDISFLFSFYIIVFLILVELIRDYLKCKKENLYSYKNVKSLGLIIYIIGQFIFSLFFFIYDYLSGFSQSLDGLISSLKDNMSFLIFISFPLAALVTILVMISNIKLMMREGKTYRNMLGVILGGTICLAIIVNTFSYMIVSYNNVFFQFFIYLVYMYITYLECILLSTCILGFKAAKRIPKFDKDYIIILGCKINDDGTLPSLLRSRVDKAIEFSRMQKVATGKDIIFVPSGGKGIDEVMAEGEAMKRYLLEQGISDENILAEVEAKNTYENIRYSYKIIKKKSSNPNIAFSTTNYHVFRSGVIATNQKLILEGIGSKTKAYYWINAFIREFVATLVSEKKSHIKVLIILMILLLFNLLIVFLMRG